MTHSDASNAIPACLFVLLGVMSLVSAQGVDPKDWSDWERYRGAVQHPNAAIKAPDLERAQRNIELYGWAQGYAETARRRADSIAEQITPAYLEQMLGRTTPGCTGPCPACRAKGLPWHPNGQWSWSASTPEKLTCRVCKTVFPNDDFPETVVLQSTWDPEQRFRFIGGDTFKCFGYTYARPSLSGIIRGRKVGYVLGQLHALGIAYALTQDPRYARAAKAIFLRLAEVFPRYLVFAGYGYGEYADCDPHVACARIGNLPNDELVYPPNKPNRSIYTGYWSASRLGSSGMDGGMVSRMAQAYDLTCMATENGEPVYSAEERLRVERDVLLEGSYLAACDGSINNKSVGNRAGAAMVGLTVGHPGLVRFGLAGFQRTVEEWFLPDGGTSESPAYAMMTMGGIRNFALMLRDYSDPEGYTAPDGSRLDGFNAARDTRYGDCWQGLIWTLQGNLRHPPSADSYRTTSINADYAELIAAVYPSEEHLALLKQITGGSTAPGAPERAIFYREPGLEDADPPALSLPDIVFPFLSQGYLRTGEHGRGSLVMLNASDYGGHHHEDSLNLYYQKDGHELLSDLGYLWDHPDSHKTRRTFAHNLVMIDGGGQRGKGRRGSFHLFATTPVVKVMEASSAAFSTAKTYRRTCVQVDHGNEGSYLVDIFRVEGGHNRQYLLHGPNNDYTVEGLDLQEPVAVEREAPFALRFHLGRLGELELADVEIRRVMPDGTEGPNLAPNASLARGDVGQAPPGWGKYTGEGTADAVILEDGPDRWVRFRALTPHANGKVNVALLVGDSDGYRGTKAIRGVLGATYRVRFRLRGTAAAASMNAVTWPDDPGSSLNRTYAGSTRLSPTEEWREHEQTFTLPTRRLSLDNMKQADGAEPWRITWRIDDDYVFTALAPGDTDETVLLGDEWGQRDHRNSDRGAVLPYIVRESDAGGMDAFVSVFAGAAQENLPVRDVRLLSLPEDAPQDAVALQVVTKQGVDVVVSMLTPTPVTVDTPLGTLQTDGAAAVVLGRDEAATAACLVGGSSLTIGGISLTAEQGNCGGEIVGVGAQDGSSHFILDGPLPDAAVGSTLYVTDGEYRRAYPIRGLERDGDHTIAYTKKDNVGFEARGGERWEFIAVSAWERQ